MQLKTGRKLRRPIGPDREESFSRSIKRAVPPANLQRPKRVIGLQHLGDSEAETLMKCI